MRFGLAIRPTSVGLDGGCQGSQTPQQIYRMELQPVDGGEGGIRTHGTRKGTTVFETARFNHSRTSPCSLRRLKQSSILPDSAQSRRERKKSWTSARQSSASTPGTDSKR